ncbi:MAG TPA: tetratricopeptide repeat protein [Candidatus Sulfotelmatobacter sp.]|nr:tetratricopeptide repeat protein [Candidatus Sulfotelmatobacter sp.]
MAFGFGFNKQKVLASAEKYVQQGKLPNAISEYEKILKNDPKDLTVTNTVGDLYARLGENDKATDCFKNVGDAYASQGFTVKAIAMYKKISKLKPSLENVLKLAELYTQQGLFNDARAQYLQVAEEFLKGGELENAVRIFQKILEMDPENTGMRVRLAEVYVRLGKKNEAWEIFTAAAEAMRARGSLNGAEEVLHRMLTLDPGNAYALQMQGRNLLESGDAEGAIASFQKIANLDSNPDSLRELLKAYLQMGRLSDAGTVANKLLSVHNDLSSIATFADALMQAGQYENALQVYDQHAERLLAENPAKVLENLHTIIGHVRDNPDSLQKLLDLFHKAGETTHVGEVTELLAHASVQSGDLVQARDMYQKLATLEPQNTLHMQNYQQVVAQLSGSGGGAKLISPEEAAVIVDELEATSPAIPQHYSDEVSLAVRSALTDAELFISYNMPHKAMGPLLVALPMAPRDLRLNQRLAALHTRAGRFAEAAICCRTLQALYSEAGHPEEATRYGDLAQNYEARSAVKIVPTVATQVPIAAQAAGQQVPPQEYETFAQEFAIDAPADEITIEEAPAEMPANATSWPGAAPIQDAELPLAEASAVEEPTAAVTEEAQEIDLSSEWEDTVTVEGAAPVSEAPAATEAAAGNRVDETVEEIRFYVEHGMPEQAWAALAKLQTQTDDQHKIAQLRAEIEASAAPATEEVEITPVPVEEVAGQDIPVAEAPVAELPVQPEPSESPVQAGPPVVAPKAEELPVTAEVAQTAEASPGGVLQEFVAGLESELGDGFLPGGASAEVKPTSAAHVEAVPADPAVASESMAPSLVKSAPTAAPLPTTSQPEVKPAAVAAVASAVPVAAPMAASAAASASSASMMQAAAPVSAPAPLPVTPVPTSVPPAPGLRAAQASKDSPFGDDAGVDLAEMFGELKQDLESGAASTDEDPETHYNLGIAFREMGLLDEAIGELQKACQFVDRGHPFPQIMQTYTWLAQCFLEKGVPEAAVRWFEKALNVPGIDGDTRVALHYELAAAYETAGDKASALKHFMDVYGSNIDYRDVSERIKALKS